MTNFFSKVNKELGHVGKTIKHDAKAVGKTTSNVVKTCEHAVSKVYGDTMSILKGITNPTMLIAIAAIVLIILIGR